MRYKFACVTCVKNNSTPRGIKNIQRTHICVRYYVVAKTILPARGRWRRLILRTNWRNTRRETKRFSRFRPVGVTRRRVGVERNVLVVRETRTARGNRDRFKRGLARGSARLPRRHLRNRRRQVFFPHLRIYHRRQQSLDNTLSPFLRKRRRERERENDGKEQMRGMDLATSGGHSRADVYAAQETDNEREVVSGFGFWMI